MEFGLKCIEYLVLIEMLQKLAKSGLSRKQVEKFNQDGYLHLSGVWSSDICSNLRARAEKYVEAFDPTSNRSIFTTNDQIRESDEYFLSSGDKIRCFFEEGAFKKSTRELIVDKMQSINKIGHGLHDLDSEFKRHSYSPHVQGILASLEYKQPVAVQSMYIFKQPSIGGEVRAHQDGTFLYTKPQSVLGFWWALEDCTVENGCLWGIPGSHKTVPIPQHFKRNPQGDGTLMEPNEVEEYDKSEAVPIFTKKGDLVLLHHSFVHFSNANTSPFSRHAYALHVVESFETEYPKDNWLQLPKGKAFTRVF